MSDLSSLIAGNGLILAVLAVVVALLIHQELENRGLDVAAVVRQPLATGATVLVVLGALFVIRFHGDDSGAAGAGGIVVDESCDEAPLSDDALRVLSDATGEAARAGSGMAGFTFRDLRGAAGLTELPQRVVALTAKEMANPRLRTDAAVSARRAPLDSALDGLRSAAIAQQCSSEGTDLVGAIIGVREAVGPGAAPVHLILVSNLLDNAPGPGRPFGIPSSASGWRGLTPRAAADRVLGAHGLSGRQPLSGADIVIVRDAVVRDAAGRCRALPTAIADRIESTMVYVLTDLGAVVGPVRRLPPSPQACASEGHPPADTGGRS